MSIHDPEFNETLRSLYRRMGSAEDGKKTGYRDSVGFFLPLPANLAKQFPSRAPEDLSPPHCTFLYVGSVPVEREEEFLQVSESLFGDLPPRVTATLGEVDYFHHHDKDRSVAFQQVLFDQDMEWQRLHLINGLRQAGFDVSDSWRVYKPHTTIAYIGLNEKIKRAPVQGSWEFDTIEVWGLPKLHTVRLGTNMAKRVAHRFAAQVGTDTASIYAIDPAQMQRLMGRTLDPGQLDQVVRQHGGAVFHTGHDGSFEVSVEGALDELGYVEPYGTPEFGLDIAHRVAARYQKKVEDPKGGKPRYEYGPRQVANRNKRKAEKAEKLRKSIGKLREQVRRDLGGSDATKQTLALVVALLDQTYERVGNESSAKEGHFGVTGWRKKHISFSGDKATLTYTGKSGVKHKKTVTDKKVVSLLKKAVEGKGADDHILTCDGEDGPRCVDGGEVNKYLKAHGITAKDIRGFHANREMVTALKAVRSKGSTLPTGRKEKDKILKDELKKALEEVAKVVGHEPSTLKSDYLVPGLVDSYLHDGTVVENFKQAKKTESEKEDDESERLVRPSPKKKPPRKDKRRERVHVKDPDVDTGDRGDDKDLSLNYKRVGSVFPRSSLYTKGSNSGEVSRDSERHPRVSARHTQSWSTNMSKMTKKGAQQVVAGLQRYAELFQTAHASMNVPEDIAIDFVRRLDMMSDHLEKQVGILRNASGEIIEASLHPSVPEKDGFDPTQIAEKVPGYLEGDADESDYMGTNFTEQEHSELREKQEAGKLPMAEKMAQLGFDQFFSA